MSVRISLVQSCGSKSQTIAIHSRSVEVQSVFLRVRQEVLLYLCCAHHSPLTSCFEVLVVSFRNNADLDFVCLEICGMYSRDGFDRHLDTMIHKSIILVKKGKHAPR